MEQFPGRLYTLSPTLTCCHTPVGKMKAVLALGEKGREGQERKTSRLHLEDLKARELDKIAQRASLHKYRQLAEALDINQCSRVLAGCAHGPQGAFTCAVYEAPRGRSRDGQSAWGTFLPQTVTAGKLSPEMLTVSHTAGLAPNAVP